jgi:hypothetical protein
VVKKKKLLHLLRQHPLLHQHPLLTLHPLRPPLLLLMPNQLTLLRLPLPHQLPLQLLNLPRSNF